MYFNRFQQGDSVQYVGKKDSLASKLNGREGFVDSRIQGSQTELCVTFGDDSYILDEQTDLATFVRKAKPAEDQTKGVDVQKRRGVSGDDRKGGKRRKGQQEEG